VAPYALGTARVLAVASSISISLGAGISLCCYGAGVGAIRLSINSQANSKTDQWAIKRDRNESTADHAIVADMLIQAGITRDQAQELATNLRSVIGVDDMDDFALLPQLFKYSVYGVHSHSECSRLEEWMTPANQRTLVVLGEQILLKQNGCSTSTDTASGGFAARIAASASSVEDGSTVGTVGITSETPTKRDSSSRDISSFARDDVSVDNWLVREAGINRLDAATLANQLSR
jgi:hypothetical protein